LFTKCSFTLCHFYENNLQSNLTNGSEQHAYAKRVAVGIGIPGFLMTLIAILLKRVRTPQDFFSVLTLVQAVTGFVIGVVLTYLGGLFLWKLKRKLETF